jgi:hypothetical protein
MRVVVVREISVMQLKKSFRRGYKTFAAHMEEATIDKVESLENHLVLRDFEDAFEEIPGFPWKRDIDFSIDLVLGATPMSNMPYIMGTPKLKSCICN